MNKSNINNTLLKLITVLTHALIISGCLLSTNLKSPILVKWEETKVVLDTECRDTKKWYEKCKNRFNKKAALNLAQKYCSFSNRVAHPDYYWNCADTSSQTTCTTSEAIVSYSGGPKETTTCNTSDVCNNYVMVYNCVPEL